MNLIKKFPVKVFAIIIVCVFISREAYSQISLGVKGGITANEMVFRKSSNGNPWPYNYHIMTSLHAGIFTKVKLTNNLHLIPELQYIQKYCNFHGIVYSEVKLSYIEIPFLVSFQPIKWLGVDAGGSYGINIKDKSLAGNYTDADAGLIGGLRFNLTKDLSLLSRYYYGLTPIGSFISDLFVPLPEYKAYNQNLQFSVAYSFK